MWPHREGGRQGRSVNETSVATMTVVVDGRLAGWHGYRTLWCEKATAPETVVIYSMHDPI